MSRGEARNPSPHPRHPSRGRLAREQQIPDLLGTPPGESHAGATMAIVMQQPAVTHGLRLQPEPTPTVGTYPGNKAQDVSSERSGVGSQRGELFWGTSGSTGCLRISVAHPKKIGATAHEPAARRKVRRLIDLDMALLP